MSYLERKRGQVPFAGTALRVLRTKGTCPLFRGLAIRLALLPILARSLSRLLSKHRAQVLHVGESCVAGDLLQRVLGHGQQSLHAVDLNPQNLRLGRPLQQPRELAF